VNIDELAKAVAAQVPKRGAFWWLARLGRPVVSDDAPGRCPKCGRALPVGSMRVAAATTAGIRQKPTREECIAECLVDGPRAKSALECSEADALDAIRIVREACATNGWKKWSANMPSADLERSGQQLEMLRRTGPKPLGGSHELDALVATVGQFWPTR
jgi:hypothetical protein